VCDFRDGHRPLRGVVRGPARVTVLRAARLTPTRNGARLDVDLASPPRRRGHQVDLGDDDSLEVAFQ
jgi:hypothetical protein